MLIDKVKFWYLKVKGGISLYSTNFYLTYNNSTIVANSEKYGNIKIIQAFFGLCWGIWFIDLTKKVLDVNAIIVPAFNFFPTTFWQYVFMLNSFCYFGWIILYYPSFVKNVQCIPDLIKVDNTIWDVAKQALRLLREFILLLGILWLFIIMTKIIFKDTLSGVLLAYGIALPFFLFVFDFILILRKSDQVEAIC
jgi:hypothetical protein